MKKPVFTFALAAMALGSAQAAQAQQACVEPADLTDTVTYAVPLLYDGLQTRCAAEFSQSAFMQNDADAFVDGFRAQQDNAWPAALRLLKLFMVRDGEGEDPMVAMISSLPDESLRPFVDGIITQLVSDRLIKDDQTEICGEIAEGMELLAPLPAENVSGLVTFIARQVDLDNPELCKPGVPISAE